MAVHIEMPSERCSDGIFYGFGFDFNLFCLKYRLKTLIATRHYSGLTKIRTRRRAADSTDSTEPIHLVLQHLRESFSLS
ncbi:TPA: transposase [Neisseria meningitidis]|uniref:Transposase n=2 Tax=Neisseria meningitidis TaxID=487 RepID=I4E7K3_NEIME|nr:transposase [Neisseria meningitidis]CCA45321.1 transposase [Neisseria meningitidis alpha522]MBJ7840603.1 transposase [Neisseria meningitidis]MBW3918613.1 transposase [Neisseria meningitidis]RJR82964.1 transposase [Neisseria meningitidis]